MKKIVINDDACIACGLCTSIAPNSIKLDDSTGRPVVISAEVNPENEKEINDAADGCPMGAIDIVEEEKVTE